VAVPLGIAVEVLLLWGHYARGGEVVWHAQGTEQPLHCSLLSVGSK
jgi:hypothetical protein